MSMADLWHSWRFGGGHATTKGGLIGAVIGAGCGCLLSYLTLIVGDRITSDWTVVLACNAFGTGVGLCFGSFIGTILFAGYPLQKTMSFWAGVLIMGSLWTLFVPPFWDKVLYPTANNFIFSGIGWTSWDWRIVQAVVNANMSFFLPAGIIADLGGAKWGPMQTGLIGASFIAIGYTVEGLVNSTGVKNITASVFTALLYAQGSAFASVAVLHANLPRFGTSTANWGTMSGIFQASFSLASTTWMLATWTYFGDAPSTSAGTVTVFYRRVPIALFVGMASLALARPKDTSSLIIDPKLSAAPREKVEYVFGWHLFPQGLFGYLVMVGASGAMIEWLALKPPGLLAFPVATAIVFLLPLCFAFAYGVTSLSRVEQIWSGKPAVAASDEPEDANIEILSTIDPVPSVHGWEPNTIFIQNSIMLGVVVGSSHTLASNLYELSDMSSCEMVGAERSSVTDFYWFTRCFACMIVGYSVDRARRKLSTTKTGNSDFVIFRHCSMIALVAAAAQISTLVFRSTTGYCIGLPFLLIASGLGGAAMGAAFTILPLLTAYVSTGPPGHSVEVAFGFSLGLVSIGPVVGIIVMYALISPFISIYLWTSLYAAACLGVAWNCHRLEGDAAKVDSPNDNLEDTKPLLVDGSA